MSVSPTVNANSPSWSVQRPMDPGTLKRVLRERNRDEHADEIARYMHVSKDCRVGCPGRTIISGGREGRTWGRRVRSWIELLTRS